MSEIFYQPYMMITEENSVVTQHFRGVPAGNYQLEVGDLQNDGICCDYGIGSVKLSDRHGETLWMLEGGYGAFHGLNIHVDDDGEVTVSDDQDIYVSPSALTTQSNMRLLSRDPSTFDPLWPGEHPTSLDKMVVNVKLDMFPTEASWNVLYLPKNKVGAQDKDWKEVLSVEGVYANQVVSNELAIEPGGLYHFIIDDSGGDGICCQYRNGFITITKKKTDSDDDGVVFQHNGNFEDSVEVYLKASDDGTGIQIQ